MMNNGTARTLKWLRDRGYEADRTERWNNFAGVRQDLFGVFDILAIHPRGVILGVQVTTPDHVADRRSKILTSEKARTFVLAGGVIQIHSWKPKIVPGRKRAIWQPRQETITLDQFPDIRNINDTTTTTPSDFIKL